MPTSHRPVFVFAEPPALATLALLLVAAAGVTCRDATAQRAAPTPSDSVRGGGPPSRVPPNPLLSRGRPVSGWSPVRFAAAKRVVDGDPHTAWNAGKPTPARPAWVSIDVGVGPSRVVLRWSANGSFNYDETDYGSPGAYRVETSADSSDGEDGSWRTVVDVASVGTHAQMHSFDFTGRRWVKFVVTSAPALSPNGVQLDEIDVHDASSGVSDTWFFMGDSITAFAFGRPPASEPGFAARVHRRHPERYPVVIGGGIGGEKSDEGAKHIDDWLAKNPDVRFWAIGYGTNDAAGDASDASGLKANLRTIVDRVRRAGRVPILASIPHATDGQHGTLPRFNVAIEELRRDGSLPGGPDLYSWFFAHPGELADGIHPNDKGIASINRLWADAAEGVYSP